MTLEHLAQVPERINLNLPNPLPGYTNLSADLLERRSPVTMQTETPLYDSSLLFAEFTNPVIHDVMHIVCLGTSGWFSGTPRVQAVNRAGTPTIAAIGPQRHTLVQ